MKHQKRTPRIPSAQTGALCLLALLALLAPAAAQAKQARLFVGTFGAATNPSPFPANPYPLENAESLAVDESSHDVYVSDPNNHRILKFDSGGHFLLMIGREVNKTKVEEAGSTEAEQNLCTAESLDVCQAGKEGSTPGAFENPTFLAVDNSSGPSKGDLYVASEITSFNGEKVGTVNEQQTVTVNATGGSFTLSFEGQTTAPIAFDAPAESVEASLGALPTIGNSNLRVSGSPGAYTVKFRENLAGRDLPQMTADSSALSGGTATATVATTVQGHSNARVEKFDPFGHVVSGWGEGGQLDGSSISSPPAPVAGPFGAGIFGGFAGIAVDPAGNLWVDASRQMFEFRQDSSFATGWQPAGASGGIAVDSEDNLYLNANGSRVEKYASSGEEVGVVAPSKVELNEGKAITPINGLTVDPASDDLYLDGQKAGEGIVQRYDSSCKPVITSETPQPGCAPAEAFGAGLLSANPRGIAIDSSNQEIYVAEGTKIAVFAFLDLPEAATTKPLNPTPTAATLTGTVNPGGVELNEGLKGCRFEWGLTAAPYEHTAPCDKTEAQIGKGNLPVEVKAPITGLEPGKTYHYRLVVSNPNDSNESIDEPEHGADLAFGPPAIKSASALDVAATSATLEARINPNNADTHARFEYVTQQQFELNGFSEPFSTTLVNLPAAGTGQSIAPHLQGLAPHTTYRYRVLAESALGAAEGEDLTFTTQATSAFALPDHRAWELVSPADKRGSRLLPIEETGVLQAAAGGDAISYLATAPTEAEPQGNSNQVQILSARGSAGWASRVIAPPHQVAPGASIGIGQEYRFFSADLSQAIVQPFGASFLPLSPEASEQTAYLRTDFPAGAPPDFCAGSCYRPLVNATNVSPEGVEFGTSSEITNLPGPQFVGASADASHIVLQSKPSLLEGAPASGGGAFEPGSLYEWSAGQLTLISVRPGAAGPAPAGVDPKLGSNTGPSDKNAHNAISTDGSRVIWSEKGGSRHLYLRDIGMEETVQLDAPEAACTSKGGCKGTAGPTFQTASADGSVVFFTDTQQLVSGASTSGADLYECEIRTNEEGRLECRLTDLTPETAGEPGSLFGNVLAAEDGAYVYFVANAVLASGAQPGACGGQAPPTATCNLYVSREGHTAFVSTLSQKGSSSWQPTPSGISARVSPNGHWLAFMSQDRLTGYDNRDATTGEPDQEVYLYHAPVAGEASLVCASCNPTGARPHGVRFSSYAQIVTHNLFYDDTPVAAAASLPGRTVVSLGVGSRYQPRYLSDSGRLFFNSADALVPADSNGTQDVYQYEPLASAEEAPPGDTCTTTTSSTFAPASAGCIDLISSGESAEETAFLDASENGDDVFFYTSGRLSRRDLDTAPDVYDASVNGGEAAPVQPPICEGDGCQHPAVPPNHPTPGTALLNGPENALECSKGKVKKSGKCVAKKHKKAHKRHHKTKHKRAANNRRATK